MWFGVFAIALIAVTPLGCTYETGQTNLHQNEIAFDSTGEDGYTQVYIVNPDGSSPRQLTNTIGKGTGDVKGNQLPRWSPDRTKIAFVSTRDGTWEIYVMDADGSNQQRLTHTTKGYGNSGPYWSPDGKKILFNSDRHPKADIYVIDADGSNEQRLTRHPATDAGGKWSPDGEKILFYSDRDGNTEIYVMDADGANQQRLTHHPSDDGIANWSPDGTKIAFYSNRHTELTTGEFYQCEVYVMDSDGSNVRRLTYTEGKGKRSWFPAWSRDGKRIVFHSNRDGISALTPVTAEGKSIPLWKREDWYEYEIYVMDANGSNVQRLTFNRKIDLHPHW